MSSELQTRSVAEVASAVRGGLLDEMSQAYGLSREMLHETLKRTIFPSGTATNEQLAAFCAVAHHYDLNPFLREISAFPAKGGGVVPIVSVDGWYKIINRHPQFDGLRVEEQRDASGNLVAFTCTIWRKDRAHETTVTEYLAECRRDTEPWRKQPTRFLRHRAIGQCARVAFGFGGIFDEHEGAIVAQRAQAPEAIEVLSREIAGAAGREALPPMSETAPGTPASVAPQAVAATPPEHVAVGVTPPEGASEPPRGLSLEW